MKKIFAIVLGAMLFAGIQTDLSAQGRKDKGQRPQREQREKMDPEQMFDRMVDRKAETMNLSDAAREPFKALYKEFLKEQTELQRATRPSRGEEAAAKDDATVEKEIFEKLANQKKLVELKEIYYPKFREILTVKQIQSLYFETFRPQGQMQPGQRPQGPPPGIPSSGFAGSTGVDWNEY
jgi:hypothetical protein